MHCSNIIYHMHPTSSFASGSQLLGVMNEHIPANIKGITTTDFSDGGEGESEREKEERVRPPAHSCSPPSLLSFPAPSAT
jgi:hypothetical protein